MILRGLLLAGFCVAVQAQVLAPNGTLRATFLAGNPVQGRVDPKTGAASGLAVELAQELGRTLGVPVVVTGVSGVRAVIDSIRNHTADIGFLAFDPTRAAEVDYSQIYLLAWSTYLVPANAAPQGVADVDRPGIRIGTVAGDSPELFLSRNLKNAELEKFASVSTEEALKMLGSGEIQAYAANRQRLTDIAAGAPGVRVLPDNFFAVRQAIIVPKGNGAALDVVNRFLASARSSGLIRAAIDRAKLDGAVDVAPAPGR
jgi:polar amino acid transport system substrate-binding protein